MPRIDDPQRDPFTDPLPGDVLADPDCLTEAHVHEVKNGVVYYGKWKTIRQSLGTYQMTTQKWAEKCASEKARILQRAEEATK